MVCRRSVPRDYFAQHPLLVHSSAADKVRKRNTKIVAVVDSKLDPVDGNNLGTTEEDNDDPTVAEDIDYEDYDWDELPDNGKQSGCASVLVATN